MYSTFHKPKINSKMNPLQDKFQRMLRLQSRLGDWELIRPGRELVKEGELEARQLEAFADLYLRKRKERPEAVA